MLPFFPRGVLDEILNLIESVSEEFPSYSSVLFFGGFRCSVPLFVVIIVIYDIKIGKNRYLMLD